MAREHVAGAGVLVQQLRQCHQHLVAHGVTMGVVDFLEVVQIEQASDSGAPSRAACGSSSAQRRARWRRFSRPVSWSPFGLGAGALNLGVRDEELRLRPQLARGASPLQVCRHFQVVQGLLEQAERAAGAVDGVVGADRGLLRAVGAHPAQQIQCGLSAYRGWPTASIQSAIEVCTRQA